MKHSPILFPFRSQRGQALLLIALGMIVLLAFIGLTVDVGILFIAAGHLRRAVDSAALSAAAQFREGRSLTELTTSANEFIALNGVTPLTVTVDTCDSDATLCTNPRRKLVHVAATAQVDFVFLPIINVYNTVISANSTSEAASVDVVLAIDTSDSMTFDAPPGDPMRDAATCNAADPTGIDGFPGDCHPFQEVKAAAVAFLSGFVYAPYDRVSIVTFAQVPTLQQPITSTATITDTINLVKGLQVSIPPSTTPTCTYPPDPSGCTNTSIGGGLAVAGNEFARPPIRQDSLWVVILLTDGAANASQPDPLDPAKVNRYCPDTTWAQPFCRDFSATTRHSLTLGDSFSYFDQTTFYDPVAYDSDDYARDMADFVGCRTVTDYVGPVPHDCSAAHQGADWTGGQGAVIYTIGLGPLVIDNQVGGGDPDAGEQTIRYAAAVGDDGDPMTDPCYDPNNNHDPVTGVDPDGTGDDIPVLPDTIRNCGDYYYAPSGNELIAVFESIASRIFTRLTH